MDGVERGRHVVVTRKTDGKRREPEGGIQKEKESRREEEKENMRAERSA